MNWYKVFWWISTADGVKSYFDTMSNIFTWFWVISFIILMIMLGIYGETHKQNDFTEEDEKSSKYWISAVRKCFIWFMVLSLVTWTLYIITPTRKDAIFIVAGGAVGNFITSDSSAKAIPYELTLLVREKIKSEIQDIKNPTSGIKDTLLNKSKEELIELLKNK